jgi:alkylation response protein AidB-like acyl-CoA dehydrogenase
VAFPSYSDPGATDDLPAAASSGKGHRLAGRLDYLVLGSLARWAIVPARTEGRVGWSFFLVDLAQPGVELSAPVFSLGMHACPASDLVLKGAGGLLIGAEGNGAEAFGRVSGRMHLAAAAMNAGIMKGSYQEALAYSQERLQGGREIINWSEVTMILAGMNIRVEVAELCVTQACLASEKNAPGSGISSVAAALHVHELACEAVTDGIQVLGGNGYMKDYGQEKRYRDARQVQALLGSVPLRKLALMREAQGKNIE